MRIFFAFLLAAVTADALTVENCTKKKGQSVVEKLGPCYDNGGQPDIRLWGNVEYLFWWSKKAPLNTPLISTGSAADSVPAALGQPNTQVLYGNHSISFDPQSGFRIGLRSWMGKESKYGVEVVGLYLPAQSKSYSKSSNSNGLPVLGVPFNNISQLPLFAGSGGWNAINNTGETALLAADGSAIQGKISVRSKTSLWDLECNGLFNLIAEEYFKLSFQLGFLFTDLSEELKLSFSSNAVAAPLTYRVANIQDKFRTVNTYYGGQLGLKGEYAYSWWFMNFQGKISLGDMIQYVKISGAFSDPVPLIYNSYGAGNNGIFAQPTNIGNHHKNRFAIVPQITLRFGGSPIDNLRFSLGYDFLYLSSVVRPGKQIDRSINETQAGPSSTGGAPNLTGPAQPSPLHKTTGYWAQGVNIGTEFRF